MKPPLIAFCLLALSTAACSGEADIPDTPDLRALLQSYARPTASLDVTTVADALNSVPNFKEIAAGLQSALYVMTDVNYASKRLDDGQRGPCASPGIAESEDSLSGERTDPNYDESVNGSISLTLAVADNRIKSSIGGIASACVLQGTLAGLPARVLLDGPIDFDMGGDVGLGETWSGTLLVSLAGELTVADFPPVTSVSARLTSGRVQSLVRLPNGTTVVLELGDSGITIRDASGVWFCAEG